MSDHTGISWTSATWNPTTGCDKVSPGCGLPRFDGDDTGGCYAMAMAARLRAMGSAKYQTDGQPPTSGPGFGVAIHPDTLDQPLRWTKPRMIFVNSMSDLLHQDVPDEFVAQVFAVMALARQHVFQLLTKRHARLRALLSSPRFEHLVKEALIDLGRARPKLQIQHAAALPLPNVWIGVSVEDQHWADIRIPALLKTPAAVRFVSAEPLLGPVTFRWAKWHEWRGSSHLDGLRGIHWVIAGGESGPGARPMHPGWARTLRDECAEAGVAFFMKQLGAWRPLKNSEYPPPGETRTLHQHGDKTDPILVRNGGHNGDWDTWSPDLRVREFPATLRAATA